MIRLDLKSHWQDIYNELKDAKRENLKPDAPFAVVIKFSRNCVSDKKLDSGDIDIIKVCIRK